MRQYQTQQQLSACGQLRLLGLSADGEILPKLIETNEVIIDPMHQMQNLKSSARF